MAARRGDRTDKVLGWVGWLCMIGALLACAAGCTTIDPVANASVCPAVVVYSPEFQNQAAAALDALPANSPLRAMISDYGRERAELRACAGK